MRLSHLAVLALFLAGFAPRALAQVFQIECPGDGSLAACPCANNGGAQRGCANSSFADGAQLTATGSGLVFPALDDVVLTATHVSGTFCLIVQGDALAAPAVFDDGLSCVSGNILRIGVPPVVSSTAVYPGPGDPRVSVQGQLPVPFGGVRWYECIYRNARAAFCPAATSNRTNALRIVWHGAA